MVTNVGDFPTARHSGSRTGISIDLIIQFVSDHTEKSEPSPSS